MHGILSLQEGTSHQLIFDKVHGLHGASNTQADIFSDIHDIVMGMLEGLNGCVVAYGQTGLSPGFLLAIYAFPCICRGAVYFNGCQLLHTEGFLVHQ